MRPIPIDDATLLQFPVGAIRRVYSSPSGDLTDERIPPAEGVIFQTPIAGYPPEQLHPITAVVITLEQGDLEALAAGGRIVLGWPGYSMPVFMTPWILAQP